MVPAFHGEQFGGRFWPARRRALALYNELTGRAWIYAEVDKLASDTGVSYFLAWIQTRFMEVEITKASSMMSDLFRRCRLQR